MKSFGIRTRGASASIRRHLTDSAFDQMENLLLAARVISSILLTVLILSIPTLREIGVQLGIAVLFVLLPAQFILLKLIPKKRRFEIETAIDVIFICGLMLMFPRIWTAGLLLIGVVVGMSAAWLSTKAAALTVVFTAAGVTAAGFLAEVDKWPIVAALILAVGPNVVVYGQINSRREQKASTELQELINGAGAIFWEADQNSGIVLKATGQIYELLGKKESDLVGRHWLSFAHPDDIPAALAFSELFVANKKAVIVGRLQHQDGHWLQFRSESRIVVNDGVELVRAISFDVTELSNAHRKLGRQGDIFERVGSAIILVAKTKAGQLITEANPASRAVFGHKPEKLVGRVLEEILPEVAAELDTQSSNDSGRRIVSKDSGGAVLKAIDLDVFELPDGQKAILSEDVTESVRAEITIRHQAEHDSLTGLANRSVLLDRLRRAFMNELDNEPIALLMLDLDRFKDVNDTLGHAVGDRMLTALAARLEAKLDNDDLVVRLGGDEFAVLLTRQATRARATSVANTLGRVCSEAIEIDHLTLAITSSIGIALAPEHGRDPQTILRRADIAMYDAKRSSVPYRFFEPAPEERSFERLTLTGSIGSSIEASEFKLWFQPKVEIETGKVVGSEGLVRWHHPDHGVMPPGHFLELIQLAGSYHRFTKSIIEQGIAHIANCSKIGHDLHVAVNISMLSLHNADLCSQIETLLNQYQVNAEKLVLEVTEADFFDELGSFNDTIGGLVELGVGLSLDDFGTGYSSLSRFRHLPFTEVKIDRSFVEKMTIDRSDMVIVRSVLDMANSLNRLTVAEGVESSQTVELLKDLGCKYAQGYLFGEALEAKGFLASLGPNDSLPANGNDSGDFQTMAQIAVDLTGDVTDQPAQ